MGEGRTMIKNNDINIQKLHEVFTFLANAPNIRVDNHNELSVIDGKLQDILHEIENNEISLIEKRLMIDKIKELRIERRQIKELSNQMDIVFDYINETKHDFKKDDRFIGRLAHSQDMQEKRVYVPRTEVLEEIKANLLFGK